MFAKPVFLKTQPVPYSLRTKVEDELTHLEKEAIITPCSDMEQLGNSHHCGTQTRRVCPTVW